MALFTCAEATGSVYSIGTISSVPMMASGMRPPSRASKRAPMRDSGSITRCIGRRRSEPSPVMKVVKRMAGQDARKQAGRGAGIAQVEHIGRLLAAADAEAADPPHAVLLGGPWRRARAPRRPSRSTSSPSSRPLIVVSPSASAPNMSERCDTDLSPGARTRPPSRANGMGDQLEGAAEADRSNSRMRRGALLACRNLVLTG